jgi:hypothetical protein
MEYREKRKTLSAVTIALSAIWVAGAYADPVADALVEGKAYGDFRMRFEHVDQDNALKNANALTIRSRLGYITGDISGFSAKLEFEDSRPVASVDDYNDALGSKPEYSTVADPETTEVDQALLQYQGHGLTSKLGRQVIKYDNVRFVGDVGWRQDRQTFDALSFDYKLLEDLELKYAYINKRNRIFAEDRDIDAKDHLINASYKTSIGKIAAYSYLLEEDESGALAYDTYGISFTGAVEMESIKFLYTAEYAYQEKSQNNTEDFDAEYIFLEAGVGVVGITAKVGYEVLGSDSGDYGFSTPLATLHKFNGWADQFLTTPNEGLVDMYASVSGKLLGGKWVVAYHDFSADEDSAISDDFGDEIDVSYSMAFGKHYYAGVKYAAYSAEDPADNGAKTFADTDKFWIWAGAKF